MAGFGATPVGSDGIPLGCVISPGDPTPRPLQGGDEYTDSQGNISAPAAVTNVGGMKSTYVYSIFATAPYATPTDWIVLRGSATKLIKVVRIEFSGAATAATAGIVFTIRKHTIANTGGTQTQPTLLQLDSLDPAPTATLRLYSAAPVIDASAQVWKVVRTTLTIVAQTASNVVPDRFVWDYNDAAYEPLTLRGVAQECAINFNGAAIPAGGVYDYSICWCEE